MAIDRAARVAFVGHAADGGDVCIDGVEVALHAATIGESARIGLSVAARKTDWIAVGVGRGHVDKSTRVGVGLVVVVGDVESVSLPIDQGSIVAGLVKIDVGDHFTFKVIRFAI